jgi:uncharacterized membrane protein (UPF0136 family)
MNTGDVTSTGSGDQIGGIIGRINDNNVITLSSITNTGDVTGDDEVGGIVGYIRKDSKVTLSEITNTGDVTGDDEVGGIVGYIRDDSKVTLSEITNTGDVTGDDRIGGIIGRVQENSNVTLSSVTNSGDITSIGTSGDEVAGIIGRIEGSTVHMTNAVNHGTIEGQTAVGGIVGHIGDAAGDTHFVFNDVMNMGTVNATTSNAGGLIGTIVSNGASVEITNAYNAATITSPTSPGAIISSISNSPSITLTSIYYLDTVAGGVSVGAISNTASLSGTATAKTDADLKVQNTFVNWDFTIIWTIDPNKNNGYPTLQSLE